MFSPERLLFINPAREAVADAMMAAQYHLYRLDLNSEDLNRATQTLESLTKFQKRETSGLCNMATNIVVTYLAYKKPELFSSLVIVQGTKDAENKFVNPFWIHHKVFMAKAIDGMYYAGSPANYSEERNRLTEIFSSGSIHEVMDQIKELEGGVWPIDDYIEEVMNSHSFRFPKRKESAQNERLTALTIVREQDKNSSEERLRVMPFELYDFENGKIVVMDRGRPSPMAVW